MVFHNTKRLYKIQEVFFNQAGSEDAPACFRRNVCEYMLCVLNMLEENRSESAYPRSIYNRYISRRWYAIACGDDIVRPAVRFCSVNFLHAAKRITYFFTNKKQVIPTGGILLSNFILRAIRKRVTLRSGIYNTARFGGSSLLPRIASETIRIQMPGWYRVLNQCLPIVIVRAFAIALTSTLQVGTYI